MDEVDTETLILLNELIVQVAGITADESVDALLDQRNGGIGTAVSEMAGDLIAQMGAAASDESDVAKIDQAPETASDESINGPSVLHHHSPPTDLSTSADEMIHARPKADLEFFNDIFDVMPTQFYASQRESLVPTRKDFFSPFPPPPSSVFPCTPKRSEPVQFLSSPTRSQWNQSQDLFKSPPFTPRNYLPKTPDTTRRTPGWKTKVATPQTPKSRQLVAPMAKPSHGYVTSPIRLTESYIMTLPAATPRMTEFVYSRRSQSNDLVPPSPGNEMISRLNNLLPKRKRVSEGSTSEEMTFKAPGKPVLIQRANGNLQMDGLSFVRPPPPAAHVAGSQVATSSRALPNAQKEMAILQEFCPPYAVGAYSTAPLSLHSSRKIRVGLSRHGKRVRLLASATKKSREE